MAKALHEIVPIKERVEEELMKRPGVTAVDVGYKYVGGHRTDEIAIRVMVAKKLDKVAAGDRVPADIDGVKTDVIERTYFLHDAMRNKKKVDDISLQADTGTYNPVKGGISIGPCRVVGGFVFVGTLGAIVKDNASGNPMLLSNFHVMCIDNGSHVGDTMAQPGRPDGGSCPAGVVGTLQRSALTNLVDCAVSSLSGRGYSCEIVDIGKVAGTATATLGMPVRKRGRTTGLTYGFVDSVSMTVNIDYGDGIGVKTLTNQIGIRPDTAHNAAFGDHGDSGSAVVDGGIHVVGLHFAGSNDGHGIANHFANVLTALNVSLCVAPTKSPVKDAKDHKFEKFEHKEHKIEKFEHKDAKLEKHEPKEIFKDHKPEKFELEKPIGDTGPGKGIFEGPTQPGIPDPAGPAAGALPKPTDKPVKFETKDIAKDFEKTPKDLKDHKPEAKESKDHKDGKDHKDHKDIPDQKQHKDAKDHKDQPDQKAHKDNKDHKDHKEAKEHKDLKDHAKPELKDHKIEVKELKPEIKDQFEKPPAAEGPKLPVEGGPTIPQLPPQLPAMSMPGAGLEQRLAQLEGAVASLSTFITPAMRPDLASGALTNEPDRGCGGGC